MKTPWVSYSWSDLSPFVNWRVNFWLHYINLILSDVIPDHFIPDNVDVHRFLNVVTWCFVSRFLLLEKCKKICLNYSIRIILQDCPRSIIHFQPPHFALRVTICWRQNPVQMNDEAGTAASSGVDFCGEEPRLLDEGNATIYSCSSHNMKADVICAYVARPPGKDTRLIHFSGYVAETLRIVQGQSYPPL